MRPDLPARREVMRLPQLQLFLCAAVLTGSVACQDGPTQPSASASAGTPAFAQGVVRRIVALARNVYIGADVDRVVRALLSPDMGDDLPELIGAITTLQTTAFPTRAEALADEIAASQPHFIGLQEITNLVVDIPEMRVDIDLEFLPILMAALNARGLNYVQAASVQNSSVTLAPIPGSNISVVDFDVLLVDAARVTYNPASVESRNFAVNIGVVAPGVELVRGWVALTASVGGLEVRVANTHLESGSADPIPLVRSLQAAELAASMAAYPIAIVLGDMNDLPGSPTHAAFTSSGLQDLWSEMRPGAAGYTCCHLPDLSNHVASNTLDRRFDYVFARGLQHASSKKIHGSIRLFGTTPGDRIAGPAHPLWPSDHAGVLAEIHVVR
jgi:hypothetical protein